jgi:DNA-binding CsgD family transcriptional regulator
VASHIELLERWFAAFNAHDVEGLIEVAHPAIELRPLDNVITAAAGAVYHGHDGLRSLIEPGFARFPRLRIETERPASVGGSAVVRFTFVLDNGVDPPATRAGAAVFDFRDGRIRRMHAYPTGTEAHAATESRFYGVLSPREREVLSLMAGGLNATEVAERLFLSPFTVRTHVRNAKVKLSASTAGHAIAIALRDGELDP